MFPQMAALRAVEAAVRLRSFSAAAVELGVSQSAVSQSVRQFENQIGVIMFTRRPGGIEPTKGALQYASTARGVLDSLFRAASELYPPSPRELVLGCSRALMNTWLLPLVTKAGEQLGPIRLRALDLEPRHFEGLDLAIVYGGREPPFSGAELLMREVSIIVGSPAVVAAMEGPVEQQRDNLPAPLLGSGWEDVAALSNFHQRKSAPVRLSETSALIAAVQAGRGLALLPALVCSDLIRAGTMEIASNLRIDRDRAYWLRVAGVGRTVDFAADWIREQFSTGNEIRLR